MRNLKDPRAVLLAVVLLVYVLIYTELYKAYGSEVVVLALLPVVLAGWFYGLRDGLVFSLFVCLVNGVLVAVTSGFTRGVLAEGILGSLALCAMAGVVGYLSDLRHMLAKELDRRAHTETALRISENFNQAILQALSASIAVLNRTGQIVEVNEAWKSFARENGAREDQVRVGTNYLAVCRQTTGEEAGVITQEVGAKIAAGIQSVLEGSENLFAMEYPLNSKDEKRWYLLHVTPLSDGKGGAVVSHVNITDRIQTEQKLEYLATHDAMTGLYNRAYFEQEMARMQAEGICPVSVVMADLDGLKEINDRLGHAAGDELIMRTADMLKSVFRSEDPVARMGGDEFAILLPRIDNRLAAIILNRVVGRMENPNRPGESPIRMSVGVATATGSRDLAEALKLADQRMYENKMARRKVLQESAAKS